MNKRSFAQARKLGLVALAVAAFSQPALAIDYLWQGGGGDWLDASKWTLLGVPGSGDTATISFTGTGAVDLNSTQSLDRLTMNGGKLGGAGILNTDSLVFNGGSLGATPFGPGGMVNVAGSSTFNGTASQQIDWSQTLNLYGNSTWTAGNGWLTVAGAYSSGNSSYTAALLHIGSGTTFADMGAASNDGYKILGGGSYNVLNNGTYNRNGLGTTWVRGLDNAGTLNVNAGTLGFDTSHWLNTSSGQINVAQGAQLLLAYTNLTAGAVNNAGLVTVIGGDNHVHAGASISGNWQIDRGQLFIESAQRIGMLTLNGGTITGQGKLAVGQLDFNSGTLSTGHGLSGGVLAVQGPATFNGTDNQYILSGHALELEGNSNWTAGNGWISVDSNALLHISSGTTFSDLGAASSTGYKVLGGGTGTVRNDGIYTRTGAGATWLRGLDNTGTVNVDSGIFGLDPGNWLNTSSGQINVAQGAELQLAALTLSAGAINNAGKVTVIGNDNYVKAGASISGLWQMNAGRLFIEGEQHMDRLAFNGGIITGQGKLAVGQLDFNSGTLSTGHGLSGGVLAVQGLATFNGTDNQYILSGHALELQGNSNWTAGNGWISVDSNALLHIASGTTFSDLGAASSTGYKVLGGGTVRNDGTLLRTGLGTTEARGLVNQGLVDVAEGTLAVDANFSNTGTLTVRAGALLQGLSGSIRNDGLFNGDGTVRTVNLSNALINGGTLTPGGLGTVGSLLLDGDLTMLEAGALRIDLAAEAHDQLTITSDARLGGTLQVWVAPDLALHLGDSFVVATYGQRLATSSFTNVQWLGSGDNPFTVEYGDHALTLRVTSAVPEPAAWALWLAGVVGLWTRRAQRQRDAATK